MLSDALHRTYRHGLCNWKHCRYKSKMIKLGCANQASLLRGKLGVPQTRQRGCVVLLYFFVTTLSNSCATDCKPLSHTNGVAGVRPLACCLVIERSTTHRQAKLEKQEHLQGGHQVFVVQASLETCMYDQGTDQGTDQRTDQGTNLLKFMQSCMQTGYVQQQ